MPITGKELDLKADLITEIEAAIATNCGASPMAPNCISGLAEGIANAIIPFLVANTQVNPGQPVETPDTLTGTSTGPGTIS